MKKVEKKLGEEFRFLGKMTVAMVVLGGLIGGPVIVFMIAMSAVIHKTPLNDPTMPLWAGIQMFVCGLMAFLPLYFIYFKQNKPVWPFIEIR